MKKGPPLLMLPDCRQNATNWSVGELEGFGSINIENLVFTDNNDINNYHRLAKIVRDVWFEKCLVLGMLYDTGTKDEKPHPMSGFKRETAIKFADELYPDQPTPEAREIEILHQFIPPMFRASALFDYRTIIEIARYGKPYIPEWTGPRAATE